MIHLEGQESEITRFQILLSDEMPPLADFRVGRIVDVSAAGCREFTILARLNSTVSAAVDVPTDLAMCPECAYELTDGIDRRFGYAFSSCTQCGPRYSIIRAMPYERRDTSMAQCELCPCCAEEFRQSEDRRFHAQTVACPDCGSQMWFGAENSAQERHESEKRRVGPAAGKPRRPTRFLPPRWAGARVARWSHPTNTKRVRASDVARESGFADIAALRISFVCGERFVCSKAPCYTPRGQI